MKKKKVIISICLVIILSMSAFVAVQATSGDENNIFEQLKALITGNTNRIEKLENEVDTLENEIDKLKGEITELQKPKEEEKETTKTEEKKTTTTSNSNKKPTANTTSKKPTSSNTTNKPTTTDYQKQIDTLNKEIATLKKSIEELEKQDNKQTNEIETLKTELNNKSEELKNLINSNNSNSSSNTNNVLNKKDLIGSWNYSDNNITHTITFNDNNTATIIENHETTGTNSGMVDGINTITNTTTKIKYVNNYTYTIEGNYIHFTLVNATKQVVGGTKIITKKDISTGEETTETVEIKAEEPVNNPNAYKQILYSGTVINGTLYLESGTVQFTKNK